VLCFAFNLQICGFQSNKTIFTFAWLMRDLSVSSRTVLGMKSVVSYVFLKTGLIAITATLLLGVSPSEATSSKPIYSNPRAPKLADLQSLTFRSEYVTVNGKRFTLASKNPISLRFEDKTISISAGCNTLGGNYSLTKGTLRAQSLFSSKIGCTDKLMDQDVWLNQLFSVNPKLQVQVISPKSKIKKPRTVLTIQSNLTPKLKAGKTVIKMYVYETYGFADTPLGNDNSTSLIKATCTQLLLDKATESQAQISAEQNALIFRVIAREGEYFAVTSDYGFNRINVAILRGTVSECFQG